MTAQGFRHRGSVGLRLLGFLSLSLGSALLSGCGGGPSLAKVEGKVAFKNGTPLKGGSLILWAEGGKTEGAKGQPTGTIAVDGTFKVVTEGRPGAPVGRYKVTVLPGPAGAGAGGDPANMKGAPPPTASPLGRVLNPKYEDPSTTDLIIEVAATPPPDGYKLPVSK